MRILALPAAALLALCLYLPMPCLAEALAAAPYRLRALLSRRIPEARAALAASGAALWVFLHHDPVARFTAEYDLWPDGRTETVRYDFVASRGKNVMPRVERMMRGMDDGTASGGAAGRD